MAGYAVKLGGGPFEPLILLAIVGSVPKMLMTNGMWNIETLTSAFPSSGGLKCFFVNDIVNDLTDNNRTQLIVTTHESRLLDFKLLRRDEIWFVNKDENGNSNIYSLEEYNARFDQKIDKAYLEGRYGGVPLFTTMFPIGE